MLKPKFHSSFYDKLTKKKNFFSVELGLIFIPETTTSKEHVIIHVYVTIYK